MNTRVTGHFGEWLQGRLGPAGPVVLVTLPCDRIGVEATRLADGPFNISSQFPIVPLALASEFLEKLGIEPSGHFQISADIAPGCGTGVSTASLLALARASGITSSPEVLAQACVQVEGAVDPLMLDAPEAWLWSSREAQELEFLGAPPMAEIVGGFWGGPQQTEPQDIVFQDVSDLLPRWREAVIKSDLAAVAHLSSDSAERTTNLRGPENDPTATMAERFSALGHLRAHTGSARGLIFAPGSVPDGIEYVLRGAGYSNVFRFHSRGGDR